jgi:hypothetical protein
MKNLKKIAIVKINYKNYSENECIYEGQENELIALLGSEDVVSYEFIEGQDFTTEVRNVEVDGEMSYLMELNCYEAWETGRTFQRVSKEAKIDFQYNPKTKKFKQIPLYGETTLMGWQKVKEAKYYNKTGLMTHKRAYLVVDTSKKLFLDESIAIANLLGW